MPPPEVTGLPFDEAISFFRQKINIPTRAWTDLWEGMHSRAFVVAGAMKEELIADLRGAVDKALAEGTTLAAFRKDFDRTVATHGWSYKGGRGWRTRVIYNTNLRMAYAAGKWQQTQRLAKTRPFLRYIAVLDADTRPKHRAWHGTVLPSDHAWWQSHYPPNGWNCRCTVQNLNERDLKRFGFERSKRSPPVKKVPREINTPSGKATIQVPDGIDPGFNYNVGEAAFGRGAQAVKLERHGPFEALEAPGAISTRPPRLEAVSTRTALGARARDEAGLRTRLREALGSDEAIFADPLGQRVQIGQAVVDHMMQSPARRDGREVLFPFIPELIEAPSEIWIGFSRSATSGRVRLRRRYVKLLALEKDRAIAMVADADSGQWSGLTFFRGRPDGLIKLRSGHLMYRREEG